MRQFDARRLSLCFVILSPTACGGSDAPAQSATTPLAEAPAQAVNAYCAGYGSCCASRGFVFDDTACQNLLSPQFTPESICPAPGTYDAQAAEACYAELQASFAACTKDISVDSPCLKMCNGTQSAGASCTSNLDCASPPNGSAACRITSGESSGVCVTVTHAKAGENCNETSSESGAGAETFTPAIGADAGASNITEVFACRTNDGLYCASDGTCKATIAIGTSCSYGDACVTGAHCNYSTFVCLADVNIGGACPAGNECVSTAFCGSDHICAAKKAAGEACQTSAQCQSLCDSTNLCVASPSTTLDVTAQSCANSTVQ